MSKNPHFDFSHLTPTERVRLAQDLWDSVEPGTADWPLTDAQRAELDRCLAEYDSNPDAGESWESIRDEALRELGRGNASAA
ncbi:MAG TPA: addiction module protein [Longimicrobium sp.]|nr:addiction module protein [Longimicrobium sp.]